MVVEMGKCCGDISGVAMEESAFIDEDSQWASGR
jgi:hypothetical protein